MSARVGAIAIAAGVALAAAHGACVLAIEAAAARNRELSVRWTGGLVAEVPSDGVLPRGVSATRTREGEAPGLIVTRYTTRSRGGIERSVAAPQLVGPFQDPAAPPCSGRLVVGQALLDDGRAGPGTIAAIVRRELTAALAGTDVVGLGAFERVGAVHLRWAGLFEVPFESGMFPAGALAAPAPTGYLRGEAVIELSRLDVVVVLGVLPRTDGGRLRFTVGLRARLAVENRALAWIVDRLGLDGIATRFAQGQLDTALLEALGPPPPLPLPGGRSLVVEPCPDRGIEVVGGAYAAVPLRWKLGPAPRDPARPTDEIRPPRRGPVAWPAPSAATTVSIDLDLDGLNGLLYELWRTGYLDELLDGMALHERFNRDETVATYLTLRLSPLRLALPPVIAPAPNDRLDLGLAVAVDVADGATITPAIALGRVALGFAGGDALRADVAIVGLDLTCRPEVDRLVPCYGDVVSTVRDATVGTHAALGEALTDVLTALFAERELGATAAPAVLTLDSPRAAVLAGGRVVRLDLTAAARVP